MQALQHACVPFQEKNEEEDDFEDTACPEAFDELMEEISLDEASSSKGNSDSHMSSKGNQEDDLDSVIFKAPLAGEIKRVGHQIFCSDAKCGNLSYLLHWDPPAVAANCCVHANCYITSPLLETDDDEMVSWLGQAYCFKNSSDHVSMAPKGSYNRRQRFHSAATAKVKK